MTQGRGIRFGISLPPFGEPTDARQRGSMLDEGLAVLDGLWSGKPFSFQGEHYHLEEMKFVPPPAQEPRIPIWVGGWWPNKPRDADTVAAYAAVGVNWWIEDVSPYRFGWRWEDPWTPEATAPVRERVRRGPPRV